MNTPVVQHAVESERMGQSGRADRDTAVIAGPGLVRRWALRPGAVGEQEDERNDDTRTGQNHEQSMASWAPPFW